MKNSKFKNLIRKGVVISALSALAITTNSNTAFANHDETTEPADKLIPAAFTVSSDTDTTDEVVTEVEGDTEKDTPVINHDDEEVHSTNDKETENNSEKTAEVNNSNKKEQTRYFQNRGYQGDFPNENSQTKNTKAFTHITFKDNHVFTQRKYHPISILKTDLAVYEYVHPGERLKAVAIYVVPANSHVVQQSFDKELLETLPKLSNELYTIKMPADDMFVVTLPKEVATEVFRSGYTFYVITEKEQNGAKFETNTKNAVTKSLVAYNGETYDVTKATNVKYLSKEEEQKQLPNSFPIHFQLTEEQIKNNHYFHIVDEDGKIIEEVFPSSATVTTKSLVSKHQAYYINEYKNAHKLNTLVTKGSQTIDYTLFSSEQDELKLKENEEGLSENIRKNDDVILSDTPLTERDEVVAHEDDNAIDEVKSEVVEEKELNNTEKETETSSHVNNHSTTTTTEGAAVEENTNIEDEVDNDDLYLSKKQEELLDPDLLDVEFPVSISNIYIDEDGKRVSVSKTSSDTPSRTERDLRPYSERNKEKIKAREEREKLYDSLVSPTLESSKSSNTKDRNRDRDRETTPTSSIRTQTETAQKRIASKEQLPQMNTKTTLIPLALGILLIGGAVGYRYYKKKK